MFDTPQNKAIEAKGKPKAENKKWKKKEIKPPKKITEKYLYNSGLAYIQRYPASSEHFRTVMKRKINKSCRFHTEQSEEDCYRLLDDLVIKFKDLNLLDDTAYTKGMVTSYRRRGLSSNQITMQLSMKGIPKEDIKHTLNEYDQDEYGTDQYGDIHAALIFARRKRLGPYDVMNKKEPDKALGVMARAGYSYEISKKIIEMDEAELDELLINQ